MLITDTVIMTLQGLQFKTLTIRKGTFESLHFLTTMTIDNKKIKIKDPFQMWGIKSTLKESSNDVVTYNHRLHNTKRRDHRLQCCYYCFMSHVPLIPLALSSSINITFYFYSLKLLIFL
jgi:hypothetical protein